MSPTARSDRRDDPTAPTRESTTEMTACEATDGPRRPEIEADQSRARGPGGVLLVMRRELSTKLLTGAFAVSTLLFAAMAFAGPVLLGSGGDDEVSLGHSGATAGVADGVVALGDRSGTPVALTTVADRAEAERLVADGDVDAAVLPAEAAAEGGRGSAGGYEVVVADSLDPALGVLLQSASAEDRLTAVAAEVGVSPQDLTAGVAALEPQVRAVGEGGTDLSGALVGLAIAAAGVVVVLLWGIPLATDVMQEKVSRVVEILLTSVRPWQLLAGKVAGTTVIGLVQLVAVLGGTAVALALAGDLPDLGAVDRGVAVVGAVCLVLGIVTCTALMAGLAARVERQEELSSVLQPALAVVLAPVAAAVYLVFDHAETVWLEVASLAPVFNVFVLPARMGLESVPLWQIGASLAVAVVTAAGAFALAGRVYGGAVLRAGGRVSLRDALRRS